jgi:transposase
VHTTGRRRRRRHSEQFKTESVAACLQPGMSLAAVAFSRGLNANLLRRWVTQAEQAGTMSTSTAVMKALPAPIGAPPFVPVPLVPARGGGEPIRVEVRQGATVVTVQWPTTAARQCAVWLRQLLR